MIHFRDYIERLSEVARADVDWDGYGPGRLSGGGLMNRSTGLGTFSRDKVMMGQYADSARIPDPELQALYNGNDLARTIIDLRPELYFRKGYQLNFTDPKADQSEAAETALACEEYLADLRCNELSKKALIFGRCFGGDVMVLGIDDGQDVSEPVNYKNIRTIKFINEVDRRFFVANTWYTDLNAPKFGQPATYIMVNAIGTGGATVVHESRLIRFDGAEADILKRRELAGWTPSVLQAPYDTMRAFDTSFQALSNLMCDLSQGVFSMKGLIETLTTKAGVATMRDRMSMVDKTRSAARMLVIDAEKEAFTRVATPLAGVADVIDRQMLRVSLAARLPVTVLFGRSPAGLNATGESDIRNLHEEIESEQKNDVEPKVKQLVKLVCLAKDGPTGGKLPKQIKFKWHELWSLSKLEQAQLEKTIGDRDVAYVTVGILSPGEVATSRFRDGEFRMSTEIDPALHDETLPPVGATKPEPEQPVPLTPEEPESAATAGTIGGMSSNFNRAAKGLK